MSVRPEVARIQQMSVRSKVAPQVFIPNASALRFWVVLIGIDKYDGYPLRGCVSDARLIEKYFVDDVGVPKDRIQLLLGSEDHASPDDPMYPSRTHITDMLHSLATNDKIEYGDNIVIYYAGHGSCYSYHEDDEDEDETHEYIEALCPIDCDTSDSNGIPIPDISDRELNSILSQISQTKGHHITVILDCCHSGGTSFGLPERGARTAPQTRHATLDDMLLSGHNLLKDYPGYRSILAKDWGPDMDSNVVLAACRDYEFAKAKKMKGGDGVYNGVFMHSLLRALRSDWKKEGMTYSKLVHRLDKSIHQTPLAAGRHQDERIWFQQ
ncbi:uncharacterized protein ARMOST_00055 [Armillaria ostoyae]|uniref:Peptidase C14 caspase domain-containing protein n=1 Tax=Armillaria ostoyae TaxID=47428 RepID=A0A284QK25_ARMOS|nr:uncharacterized protein ARMOST_00055 [Armillaria ostoyae]